MSYASDLGRLGPDPHTQSPELTVKHSDEFACRLTDFGTSTEDSSEPNTYPDENRLAVNVVLALSKARTSSALDGPGTFDC
jgi:hypothetical protein